MNRNIKSNNSWCSIYSTGSEISEQEFYQIVLSKGGRVHGQYTNNHNKVEVECAFGHHWLVEPNDTKAGKWCRNCAFRMDTVEEEFRQAVTSKGGLVLCEYIDINTNILIQCHLGQK